MTFRSSASRDVVAAGSRPGTTHRVANHSAETVLVGTAVGARLPLDLPDEVVARVLSSAPDSVNSLLADLLAERPMEIDAGNGVVVRLGAQHGVPTPLNAMAVAILEAS